MGNSLGARIKAIRGDMLQTDFAEKLGVHKNSLSRYERNVGSPDAQFVQSLCTIFEIEANWLLFGKEPMHRGSIVELGQDGLCKQCEKLETKLAEESKLVRELVSDNRELMRENRELNKELRLAVKETSYFKVKAGAADAHMREHPAQYGQEDEDIEARPP